MEAIVLETCAMASFWWRKAWDTNLELILLFPSPTSSTKLASTRESAKHDH